MNRAVRGVGGEVGGEVGREVVEGALLGIQLEFFWISGLLKPTWRLMKEWELREPWGFRIPVLEEEIKGTIGLAFLLGWGSLGFTMWIAWSGLLRPGEAARR